MPGTEAAPGCSDEHGRSETCFPGQLQPVGDGDGLSHPSNRSQRQQACWAGRIARTLLFRNGLSGAPGAVAAAVGGATNAVSMFGRYVIPALRRLDAGFYRCAVRNRLGALLQRRSEVHVACTCPLSSPGPGDRVGCPSVTFGRLGAGLLSQVPPGIESLLKPVERGGNCGGGWSPDDGADEGKGTFHFS